MYNSLRAMERLLLAVDQVIETVILSVARPFFNEHEKQDLNDIIWLKDKTCNYNFRFNYITVHCNN